MHENIPTYLTFVPHPLLTCSAIKRMLVQTFPQILSGSTRFAKDGTCIDDVAVGHRRGPPKPALQVREGFHLVFE